MRTTLNLDDETYQIASLYASARGITLGNAIGELIQKAQGTLASSRIRKARNGFPVIPCKGRVVTPEQISELEAEDIA